MLALPIIFALLSPNPVITGKRNELVVSPASRAVSPEAKQSRDKANWQRILASLGVLAEC